MSAGQGRGRRGSESGKPKGARDADPAPRKADLMLAHDPDAIRAAEHDLLDAVTVAKFSEASAFAIRLALEEALYNAFRHGHKNLPEEPVRLQWTVSPQEISITVTDKGPGFNPDVLPDPTSQERIELPHGRGVMLMRAYMTSVAYNPSGNVVTMTYRKPGDE
jgi:serine/threonine-protein kinase RsbW